MRLIGIGGLKKTKSIIKLFCLTSFWLMFFTLQAVSQQKTSHVCAAMSGSTSNQLVPTLLDFLLLLGVLACLFISLKVKSFLYDGELASGRNLLSISFVLFLVAQILSLSTTLGLLNVSISIISSLRLLFVISLASGIYFMKKVLS